MLEMIFFFPTSIYFLFRQPLPETTESKTWICDIRFPLFKNFDAAFLSEPLKPHLAKSN